MNYLKEFFGFGEYTREPEGYFSIEHLSFVSSLMIIMIISAVFLGFRNRNKTTDEKNKVLIISAIMIDSFEIFKILIFCIRGKDPLAWIYELPLFLCSIQLITIPIAAFSKGRLKNAAMDFVLIFGILGAVMGTYFAGNNYGSYPVLSFDNVISGITHSISGFTSLYIAISGMTDMKKRNIPITFSILIGFCIAAFTANKIIDYNYMFLVRGDGTPYDILYNLVNGNQILYPLFVVLLFLLYISLFYFVFYLVNKNKSK
ncbi:MAG: YwaF family protein [Clostridia bacterium]|nr:YwaF family protein [Clostridia bacterium]